MRFDRISEARLIPLAPGLVFGLPGAVLLAGLLAGLLAFPLDEAQAQAASKPAPAGRQPAAPAPAPLPAPAAPTPPEVPATVVRTEILPFDNWTVTCRDFASGGPARSCQMSLELVQQQQGGASQPLLNWTLRMPVAGRAPATLITPTGVQIAPGVEVRLGKAGARSIAYTACDARCSASFTFDEAWAKEADGADTAEVVIVSAAGKPVHVTVPLAGFGKAWAALKK